MRSPSPASRGRDKDAGVAVAVTLANGATEYSFFSASPATSSLSSTAAAQPSFSAAPPAPPLSASAAAPVGPFRVADCQATATSSVSASIATAFPVAAASAAAPQTSAAIQLAATATAAASEAAAAAVAARVTPVSVFEPRRVFLTVGTTQFDALARAATQLSFLQLLACVGCRHLRMQIGTGILPSLPLGFTSVRLSPLSVLAPHAATTATHLPPAVLAALQDLASAGATAASAASAAAVPAAPGNPAPAAATAAAVPADSGGSAFAAAAALAAVPTGSEGPPSTAATVATVTAPTGTEPRGVVVSAPRKITAGATGATFCRKAVSFSNYKDEVYFCISLKRLVASCMRDASSSSATLAASVSSSASFSLSNAWCNSHISRPRQNSGDCERRSIIQKALEVDEQFVVSFFRYKDSLAAEVAAADLIISHCGAGSVLQSLRQQKRLIAVINTLLQHNHQQQLARALQLQRYCLIVEHIEAPLHCRQQLAIGKQGQLQGNKKGREVEEQQWQQQALQKQQDTQQHKQEKQLPLHSYPYKEKQRHEEDVRNAQQQQQQQQSVQQQHSVEQQRDMSQPHHVGLGHYQYEKFVQTLTVYSELHRRLVDICEAEWDDEEGPRDVLTSPARNCKEPVAVAGGALRTTDACADITLAVDARAAVPNCAPECVSVRQRLRRLPPASLGAFYRSIEDAIPTPAVARCSTSASRVGTPRDSPAAGGPHKRIKAENEEVEEGGEIGGRAELVSQQKKEKKPEASSRAVQLVATAWSILRSVSVADLFLLLFVLLLLQLLLSLPPLVEGL